MDPWVRFKQRVQHNIELDQRRFMASRGVYYSMKHAIQLQVALGLADLLVKLLSRRNA